jgi:predicted dehydrogenase/nucleoside-diphosphate-sugar epimerase
VNSPVSIRVGLLGAGYILQAHAKAVQSLPGVELAAVCDISRGRAEAAAAAHGIPQAFSSLDEMLASGVDAAHVLVPPQLHVDVTRRILEAGVHAFVEKPMGIDSSACQALVELAAVRGVKLGVNHNFLFLPSYERLRAQVKDGSIGRLDHVALRWLYPLGLIQFGPYNNWMLRAESNLLFELGPHLVAFLLDLVGPLDELEARASLPIELPGAQRVLRHWSLIGRRGDTGVSLELSVQPGQPDRSVRVRGYAASAELNFERDLLFMEEARSNSALFDGLRSGREGASAWRTQAWANFGRQFGATLRKRPQANPFLDSIARSVAAFYRGLHDPALDPRLDGRFGAEVIRTCERIAASAGALSAPRPVPPAPPSAKPATVLVVGGTGFIGKRLVRALLAAGHGVRVLSRSAASARYELEGLAVEVAEGALDDPAAVGRALEGVEVVYHLAKAVGQRWQDYVDNDQRPTRVLAEAALAAGVKRFVYTGTIDSYDAANAAAVIDGSTPLDPAIDSRNLYARSKAACEALLLELHRTRGLPLVIFRPAVVIGEGCPPAHWGVGMFHSDTRVQYWGSGDNKLPLVLVDDVADALVLGLDKPGIEGQAFLLTDGPLLSAREYVAEVSRLSGTRLRATPTPIWRFFVLDVAKEIVKNAIRHPNRKQPSHHDWACRQLAARFDNRRTCELLGWQPAGTREALVERGIAAAVRHYLR